MKYIIIFEHGKNSYGASVPDLPGCIAAAEAKEDVLQLIILSAHEFSAPRQTLFCRWPR